MIMLLIYGLIAVSFIGITTLFLWNKISFSWLTYTSGLMIFSLPFERIPSLETPFGPIRVGHILALFFWYFLIVLWIKKDSQLLATKFKSEMLFLVGFLLTGLMSVFSISNSSRFITSIIAVTISFTIVFAISHFATNMWQWITKIAYLFIGLVIFTFYQLIGDLGGIPAMFTGMKLIFQSHVFGFPRVHTTFNEPSYFANALFLGIFLFLALLIANKSIFSSDFFQKRLSIFHSQRLFYFFVILGLVASFVLTIAKSAWILSPIFFVFVGLLLFNQTLVPFKKIYVILGSCFVLLLMTAGYYAFPAQIDSSLGSLFQTTEGQSATAFERNRNLNSALELIKNDPITGVGPGQFGTKAQPIIAYDNESDFALDDQDTSKLIVFNMYAEVWAEYGLLPLLSIVGLFLYAILRNFWLYFRFQNPQHPDQLMRVSLGFYLVVSMIQWNFISPLYINPIFIILGVIIYLNHKIELTQYAS
jgi:O-antigen ligase